MIATIPGNNILLRWDGVVVDSPAMLVVPCPTAVKAVGSHPAPTSTVHRVINY